MTAFGDRYDLYMCRHGLQQIPNETPAMNTLGFRNTLKRGKYLSSSCVCMQAIGLMKCNTADTLRNRIVVCVVLQG